MNRIKFPASCAPLTEEEAMNTPGGGDTLETVGKAVIAVGVSGVLLCVAGVAARGILSIFHPNGVEGAVSDSVQAGNSFIQNSVNSGQNFLNRLMGK